jgi:microcystin-dependent protein
MTTGNASNAIYGKSTTVQPKNVSLKLILKALPTPPVNAVPVGTILDYTANSAPDGYIIANGAELSRTTFSRLYNWAVSNNLIVDKASVPATAHGFYGTGNGSTTFTIPDLRGVHKRGSDLASNRGGTSLGGYLADGGMGGFPDFTQVTNIGSGYKATQNGYVFLMAQTDGNSVVTISNFSNTYSYDTGDGQSAGSTFIPIKKGDTVSFSRTSRAAFMPVASSTYGVNKSVAVNYIIKY